MRLSENDRDSERARTSFAVALIEALEQPVVVCDANEHVLANAAARAMFGLFDRGQAGSFVPEELCFREFDGRQLMPQREPLRRVLAGEHAVRACLRPVAGVGDAPLVEVRASALRDTGGASLGAIMLITATREEPSGAERLRDYTYVIEVLTGVSGMLAELHDPDEAAGVICTVATGAMGAIAVLLWELIDGELVMSRCEGAFAIEALKDLAEHTRAGASRALADASTVIERAAIQGAGEIPPEVLSLGGVKVPLGTAWHEPLASGGRVTGVLSVLWTGFLEDVERPRWLLGPLAHHAATALERAELLRRLRDAARTDPLTGLPNRRVWDETIARELARAHRESQPLSIALIDIDHFKTYNDTFGHPQGDELLHDAALAWSERLRRTDLLARIGGEEFAVLLPVCPREEARSVAERLRTCVPHGQTCSLGVVTWDAHATASELYAAADAALYRAKTSGRNRVEIGLCNTPDACNS